MSTPPPSCSTLSRNVVPTMPSLRSRISVPATLVIQTRALSGSESHENTVAGSLLMSRLHEIRIASPPGRATERRAYGHLSRRPAGATVGAWGLTPNLRA
jgi:hypothetical protein